MIEKELYRKALWSINAVLVCARQMAYDGAPHDDLADVLDMAEYLPALMLEPNDRTQEFREVLVELAARFPDFRLAVLRFDSAEPYASSS